MRRLTNSKKWYIRLTVEAMDIFYPCGSCSLFPLQLTNSLQMVVHASSSLSKGVRSWLMMLGASPPPYKQWVKENQHGCPQQRHMCNIGICEYRWVYEYGFMLLLPEPNAPWSSKLVSHHATLVLIKLNKTQRDCISCTLVTVCYNLQNIPIQQNSFYP